MLFPKNAVAFFHRNRKTLLISFMLSALMVLALPTFAQNSVESSLDTTAFENAIMSGMQIFFNNLPAFVLLGFGVFGIIFALGGGLAFAQNVLGKILNIFTKS